MTGLEQTAGLLASHPWVAAAQVVAGRGISGLLIVPADPGLQAYRCVGRAGLSAVWERHLKAPMPDLWRLVDALPSAAGDAGETAAEALLQEPLARLPAEESSAKCSDGVVNYVLRVPLELAIFRSHFPIAPIVPGVEQVGWAIAFARRHFRLPGSFFGLDMLRFRQVMQPGSDLWLELRFAEVTGALDFMFRGAGGPKAPRISDGRILFRDSNRSVRNVS